MDRRRHVTTNRRRSRRYGHAHRGTGRAEVDGVYPRSSWLVEGVGRVRNVCLACVVELDEHRCSVPIAAQFTAEPEELAIVCPASAGLAVSTSAATSSGRVERVTRSTSTISLTLARTHSRKPHRVTAGDCPPRPPRYPWWRLCHLRRPRLDSIATQRQRPPWAPMPLPSRAVTMPPAAIGDLRRPARASGWVAEPPRGPRRTRWTWCRRGMW